MVGLTTYGRILGANVDDLRAIHSMTHIRHAYVRLAPGSQPFFTSPVHDDMPTVLTVYGDGPDTLIGGILHGVMTSGGMIGMMVSMLAGVFAGVVALLLGVTADVVLMAIGFIAALLTFVALVVATVSGAYRAQAAHVARFPAPEPIAESKARD